MKKTKIKENRTVVIAVRIKPSLDKQLNKLCAKYGIKKSSALHLALQEYVLQRS